MHEAETAASLALDNGLLRVELNPARGAEIRFAGRPGGPNVLAFYDWASPLPASRSVSYGDATLDWMSEYRGGWQELFPNPGHPCEVDGVPLPFHGEASASAWTVVSHDERHAVLRTAARLPLTLERRMTLAGDAPTLRIEETVRNESSEPVAYLWGHHPAFDARPGTLIDVPAHEVRTAPDMTGPNCDLVAGAEARWPHAPRQDGTQADLRDVPAGTVQRLCYLPRLAAGWAALRHAERGEGVALAWDRETFPDAWLWEEIGGVGLPWFGRARIVAIEPQSACPSDGLAAHRARGTAHVLDGGAERETWLTLSLFAADARPVTAVTRDGHVERQAHRQGGTTA